MKKQLLVPGIICICLLLGACSNGSAASQHANSDNQNIERVEYSESSDQDVNHDQAIEIQLRQHLEQTINENEKVVSSAVTIDKENKSIAVDLKVAPDEELTEDEIGLIKKFVSSAMEEPSAYDILVNTAY